MAVITAAYRNGNPLTLFEGNTPIKGGGVPFPSAFADFVVIGDSTVVGESGTSGAAFGWVGLLATLYGATALNRGIGGTVLQNSADAGGSPRSNNMRDRYLSDMTGASKRAFAFVAGGGNDGRYTAAPATFNVENYTNDLREMLWGLLAAGYQQSDICVVAPIWKSDVGLNTGSAGFTGQSRAGYEAFVEAAKSVAREFGVYLADAYAAVRDNGAEALISADDIHLNDAGHQVVLNQAILKATRIPVSAPADPYASYFVFDTFSDVDGRGITGHSGERGAKWAPQPGVTNGGSTIHAGAVVNNGTGVYQAFAEPPSADYTVTGKFLCRSGLTGDSVAVAARMSTSENTLYWAGYSRANGGFRLFKTVAGTPTQLGSTYTMAVNVGQEFTVALQVSGSTIKMFVDGVERVSVTDSAIAAAGRVGMRNSIVQSPTTGCHLTELSAA